MSNVSRIEGVPIQVVSLCCQGSLVLCGSHIIINTLLSNESSLCLCYRISEVVVVPLLGEGAIISRNCDIALLFGAY